MLYGTAKTGLKSVKMKIRLRNKLKENQRGIIILGKDCQNDFIMELHLI